MNITVFNENIDELGLDPKRADKTAALLEVHPNGIHNTLKDLFDEMDDVNVRTATQDQEECGLSKEVLDNTDVLVFWAHRGHDDFPDEIAENIHQRVISGMGLILLHSAHHSKVLKRTLGTSGDLRWRDDTYCRIFCVNPTHPISEGIPENFELGIEECYGECFDIPKPDDVVFLSWYDIGEVLRSGCTWTRGYGKIFYFQPGHESNLSYKHPYVRQILKNAVNWVKPIKYKTTFGAPHINVTFEEIRKNKI